MTNALFSGPVVTRARWCVLPLLSCCRAKAEVRFEDGKCFVDGAVATLAQVEKRQAEVTSLIAAHQPLVVLVTVVIVVLASTSYIERLLLLLSLRRTEAPSLTEKFRQTMERYRERPLRYFAIVGTTFCLLLVAAGFYVFLDAEKRSNEIALSRLQFCQLALRTEQASDVLDVQRRSLAALAETASGIQALVAKLPPDEKQKAQEIVDQLTATVAKENKVIADSIERSDAAMRAVETRTELVERGLGAVQTDIAKVTSLSSAVSDLANLIKQLDAKVTAANVANANGATHLAKIDDKLSAMSAQISGLDAKVTAADAALRAEKQRPRLLNPPASQPAP